MLDWGENGPFVDYGVKLTSSFGDLARSVKAGIGTQPLSFEMSHVVIPFSPSVPSYFYADERIPSDQLKKHVVCADHQAQPNVMMEALFDPMVGELEGAFCAGVQHHSKEILNECVGGLASHHPTENIEANLTKFKTSYLWKEPMLCSTLYLKAICIPRYLLTRANIHRCADSILGLARF